MRVTVIDPRAVERLGPGDSAGRWRKVLHEGGYFVEVGEDGAVGTQLLALVRGIDRLAHTEAEIERTRHPIGWLTGSVRPQVGLLLVLSFAATALVGKVLGGDSGQWWGLAITPILLGALALLGLLQATRHELYRRRRFGELLFERGEGVRVLLESLAQLVAHTFVLRTSGGWLVGAPDLDGCTRRLADLRASYRVDSPAGHVGLMAELRAELERVEGCLRVANLGAPPAPQDLKIDLGAFDARIRALGDTSSPR